MPDKIPFGLYDIDRYYLDYLRNNNNEHIPKSNYEDEGGARKFYCGPVYNADGIPMFVPVSHQKRTASINGKYMISIEDSEDNATQDNNIKNTKNIDHKIIGCLDFRFMVPCLEEHFVKHEISTNSNILNSKPTFAEKQAHILLSSKNQQLLEKTAKLTFDDVTAGKNVARSSVDFNKALDDVWNYEDYIEAHKDTYKPDPFITKMKARFQNTIDTFSINEMTDSDENEYKPP